MGIIEDLELFIGSIFSKLGFYIGQNPVKIIVTSLILMILSGLGLIRFDEANNVRTEYSPLNAPSRIEYAIAQEFLGQVIFLKTYIFI